ncbi:MAG: bifunctional oligoribonuclease/PAP phosphatase NrnA [Haliscomenobacteraceae bacterium CHB4]|nr:Bifunctional oligoribonuclease and PAP phosphatase NrnA [Saprospiraceae bacterium]MCE7922952.1 bifunctional oligoribonuclease/PAP phosphatase NrnA [Haliscomenobacteraceae bacterium CHB4]
MEFPAKLKQLVHHPQNVAILSHRNPDGDAIGSSLAMRHYLEQHGHTVHVLFPSEYPEEFEVMPGAEDILIWDIHTEECKHVLARKNVFFYLDFNALNRIDKMGDYIRDLPGVRILLDHHLYPDPIADYTYSEPESSSTCELVYRFITGIGDGQKINPTVGKCIFTGLVTDTGSFRHATNPRVYRIAADLVERGVDDSAVQDMIFNSQKEKNLRLLGHCLSNRFEYYPEYRTALIWLSKKDYEEFNIQRGDAEGIVNYLLTMKDVRLGAFIHNQPTVVKLSLRSKGDFDVQDICKKHFNGGGHKNAAGAYSHDSLKATIQKFKDLLPQYKEALLKNN